MEDRVAVRVRDETVDVGEEERCLCVLVGGIRDLAALFAVVDRLGQQGAHVRVAALPRLGQVWAVNRSAGESE